MFDDDPRVRWEYCDVPECEEDPAILGEYMEFQITWTATRVSGWDSLRFAEIEVPGLLGAEPAMAPLEYDGEYVASIVHGSTDITVEGGLSIGASSDQLALNGSTAKFSMYKEALADVPGELP